MEKNRAKKVLAIVVTYNRKILLRECIEALMLQECDILIVDNASSDGTYDHIKDFLAYDKIKYVNTEKNIGGAGGFNFGMKIGIEAGYKFLWLMDDDCIVQRGALDALLKVNDEVRDYGFLSSVALWKDGSICNMNIQKDTLRSKVSFPDNLETIPDKIPVIMASFVSFFVKADTVKKVGYPIKEFFIWSDDLEYSRRISRKYKCYIAGKSRVIHKTNNNYGNSLANDDERIERYRFAYRNDYYVFHREGMQGTIYYYCRLAFHILKIIIYSKGNRLKKLKLVLDATKEGMHFSPDIEYPQGE